MDSVAALPVVVQADVDWLSMSTHDTGACRALLEWRDRRFAVLGDEGYAERQWSAHGYQYRSRGQVAVAVGRREILCQLSGGEAAASFDSCVRWATNVSRIDLAVTGRLDVDRSRLAEEAYRLASGAPRGRGRPTELTLILGQDRGDTLYVGSRTSDQRGRLYDKGRESGEPAYQNCWRWEVQYRRAYAMSAVRSLVAAPQKGPTIAATVASWFTSRGVGATYRVTSEPIDSRPDRKTPDDERWLAWARKCVRPRAEQLAARYGWRFVAEALVGRIRTFEDWETLVQGMEVELVGDE